MKECKGKISITKHILTVRIENESDGDHLHKAYGFTLEMGAKALEIITDNHR